MAGEGRGVEVNLTFSGGAAGEEAGDAGEFASSLYRWLAAEPELRAGTDLSLRPGRPGPGPGHMGEALDIVNVVLTNGIALGSLVTAVASWRGSRPRPPQVRLERDGVVVTLQDSSPEAIERVLTVWHERDRRPAAPTEEGAE